MNMPFRRRAVTLAALTAATLLALAACSKQEPRRPEGRMDTPSHHTLRGHDFIEEGRWADAERSFDLALSLDEAYGPALAGKAIVSAHDAATGEHSAQARREMAVDARRLVDRAVEEGENDEQRRAAHVAGIRVYRLTKLPEGGWLEEAEDHYEAAVDLDEQGTDADPSFFMARAYRDAFRLNEAQRLYTEVLSRQTPRSAQADRELAELQKVIRAEPGSQHGRRIAFDESITRADVAALFIAELRLDRLYERGNAARFDTGFEPPQRQSFQADRIERAPAATDIEEHPLREDIRQIMALGVVGLEPDPAHRFHPNEVTNRAEFAMMLEDILVKVTGEDGVKTRFIGQTSPFPDLRNDLPYFNAVMTVTTRNLMEAKDRINAVFAPLEPVTGAEALLAIRQLKDELRSYLRS